MEQRKRLSPIKNVIIQRNGSLEIVSRTQYMRLVKSEEEIPKLIGTVDPYDKSGLRWEENKSNKAFNFNEKHIERIRNLVLTNLPYLANKGTDNFVNNFNELVIKKLIIKPRNYFKIPI